eukprot:m.118346 g.118346  ORF g.118346 m.118346 type:complete len:308 (-) comp17205_c0_seq1:463-1386(-)
MDTIKSGWLVKSPPLPRVDATSRKKWRRRWFLLSSSQKKMFYYADDTLKDLKGDIDLQSCRRVLVGLSHPKYKSVFSCVCPHREFYLAAESETDMITWAKAIMGLWESRRLSNIAPPVAAKPTASEKPKQEDRPPSISDVDDDTEEIDPDDYDAAPSNTSAPLVEDDDDDDLFSLIDSTSTSGSATTPTPVRREGGSSSSLLDLKFPPPPAADPPLLGPAKVLYTFEAQAEGTQISVKEGETLTVVQSGPEWSWVCNAHGVEGIVSVMPGDGNNVLQFHWVISTVAHGSCTNENDVRTHCAHTCTSC